MKPKFIELLAFDKNHNLQYEGKCKLRINRLSEMLLVEPENEEHEMKSAMFKWNFFMDKNILFIFDEIKLNDFALFFDAEKRCKKVYNFIFKHQIANNADKEAFNQRFFIPFCKLIAMKDLDLKVKRTFVNWIDKHESKEKEEYVELLKENNVYDILYSKINENSVVSNNDSHYLGHSSRKRRHAKMIGECNKKNCDKTTQSVRTKNQKSLKKFSESVNQECFQRANVKIKNGIAQRLLVFTSIDKTYCYEYNRSYRRKKYYYCNGCRSLGKDVVATLDKDENGIEYVKLEDTEHVCIPIQYIPENYIEIKVFRKPEYEILENCNTASGSILIVFDPNEKSKCWEFHMEKCSFYCRQCNARAKLRNNGTENEYIELRNSNHKCKFVLYEPKKFYQFNDFILSPNFELVTTTSSNGEEKRRLIIFDQTNRNLCYIYSFQNNKKRFICLGCCKKRVQVSAKLLKNGDGEDYVILSPMKHVCDLQPYAGVIKKEHIIRPPDFKFVENGLNNNRLLDKLFIFDSNDQSLCYKFSRLTKRENYFYCPGCQNLQAQNSNAKKGCGKYLVVKLCKDKNDEYFVQCNDTMHLCKPQKYEPEISQEKEIPKCYDYFFFRRKTYQEAVNVAFYHPKNRGLCYKFNYRKSEFYFVCHRCSVKGLSFTIKIKKDEDGKEYFLHDYEKHICKPIEAKSLLNPAFIKLNRTDIHLPLRRPEIKECNIIKPQNYELRPNRRNIPDALLFIYCTEDRTAGYKYFYSNVGQKYFCCSAKPDRCYAAAKLEINENGEKCFIMGKSEHKCQPVEYEKAVEWEEKIINADEFIKFSRDGKTTKIIVFTNSNRNDCYEFGTTLSKNSFRCCVCSSHNKYVGVRLCTRKDGQEYLQMSKQNHICSPRKYIKEKYEPKVFTNDLFELHPNSKGEANKILLIFTSAEKDFVYEYGGISEDLYKCKSCIQKELNVIAKLCEIKNGQKFVECGTTQHVCQPQKYDSTKYLYIYRESQIILNDNFVFHDGKNGEKENYLIIFKSEKKDFAYQYCKQNDDYYKCNRCRNKNQNVSAKIIYDEKGRKSIKMTGKDHICQPLKYDPTKFIYSEPKIILNDLFKIHDGTNGEKEKYLIIFTSVKKDFMYQYYMVRPGYYCCNGCCCKRQSISAKVCENDAGDKYLKLAEREHVCKPRKYDLRKFRTQ